jgi:hypothetical protein
MQCDKKSFLVEADTSKKRNLMLVEGHAENDVDLCGDDNADAKCQCLGKGPTMLTKSSIRRNSIWIPCNNERAHD